MGARAHPGSGSGPIRHDGSTEDALVEVKDAAKSITLSAAYLEGLRRRAVQQGKRATLVVEFTNGLRLEADLTRTRPA